MGDNWISEEQMIARLKVEAEQDLKRLKHNPSSWTQSKSTFTCHCQTCQATCTISPRAIGKMRIRGEAVMLRCKK